MFYYCPNCWQNLKESAVNCPHCGYDLSEYDRLSYEDKLLLALNHPVRENRMMAIEVLGRLKSQRVVPAFQEIVAATEDFHVAQAIVEALTRIGGAASEAVLRNMENHPVRLVRELAQRAIASRPHHHLE
jgi:HEAT repeat protein